MLCNFSKGFAVQATDKMIQKKLAALLFHKNVVRGITCNLMRRHRHYLLSYIFLEYLYQRLRRLSEQKLRWITLPDATLRRVLCDIVDEYTDCECCVLASEQFLKKSHSAWFHVCSMVSMKKYKCTVISVDYINENIILISETMRHNLQNTLLHERLDDSCFLLPVGNDTVKIASEATISLIPSAHHYTNVIADAMLEGYFLNPRYLHVNDVFTIDAREHAQDVFYTSGYAASPVMRFVVRSLKVNQCSVDSCYVVRRVSTLIQESKVHSYIPRRHLHSFTDVESYLRQNDVRAAALQISRYPSALVGPVEYLESCIAPFTKQNADSPLIKPLFLLKGARGCGKRDIVRVTSERLGLNLLDVDLAEVQALSSAQTEAKLRIVIQNAQQCTPCILYLSNMQVFGKNTEGQKDERVIFTFSTEMDALYKVQRAYPLIIVAASDETDIAVELQRIFTETIRVKHLLDETKRTELISWFLANANQKTTENITKIADSYTDFRFADLSTLTLLAIKDMSKHSSWTSVTERSFNKAYEYMQSVYADGKDMPRVPKVHWEDIGGLADLKHEIIRRIQLPLSNIPGFGQSGLLLYGPPGTGKTLLAKAVATEYRLHFLSIKGPEVLNMYVGQSEKNIRDIFERARSAAPCIIFFDELDSLAPNRGRSGDSGGVMDRVVSQLLAEMDGLEGSSNIFIMGATNRPDLIDPALLRPGRFDKMLYVGVYADRASQLSVLEAQTQKFWLRNAFTTLETIVDMLPKNVTGADLYSVSSNAWLNAVREILTKHEKEKNTDAKSANEIAACGPVAVEIRHFMDAVSNLVPSVSDEDIRRYEQMQTELSSS